MLILVCGGESYVRDRWSKTQTARGCLRETNSLTGAKLQSITGLIRKEIIRKKTESQR